MMEYLVFKSGGATLALDVTKIEELVLSRDFSLKDMDYLQRIRRNGEDIPLYDLCPDLITSNRPIPEKFAIIICSLDHKTALIADCAVGIIQVNQDEIIVGKHADFEVAQEYLDGVVEQDDKKIHILSPSKLAGLVKAHE